MNKAKPWILCNTQQLNLEKTFTCGQCFRWNPDNHGGYIGIASGYPARVWEDDGLVWIETSGKQEFWHDYFDLELDYEAIRYTFTVGGQYLQTCIDYGQGIRILKQDVWETLCSFILSQCNNIPRIQGIIERLCKEFGEPLQFKGSILFTFPTPEKLAPLAQKDLEVLRCGFRGPYILHAARLICEGTLDLSALEADDYSVSIQKLKQINGVGDKVANCVALFGLHKFSGFPIDVWMRRALDEHFPQGFHSASLGSYAGLAQQYIFYYARSHGKKQLSRI